MLEVAKIGCYIPCSHNMKANPKLVRLLYFLALAWVPASQVWYYLQFAESIRLILNTLRAEYLR